MQVSALQALPIGPLSSRINLSVHSSLPALLAVLALVLTPQEPANPERRHDIVDSKLSCQSLQPTGLVLVLQKGRTETWRSHLPALTVTL